MWCDACTQDTCLAIRIQCFALTGVAIEATKRSLGHSFFRIVRQHVFRRVPLQLVRMSEDGMSFLPADIS